MKRVFLLLLVLAFASLLFYSCDQKEETDDGNGTGVGVASPSNLPEFTGPIPSSNDTVINTLSSLTSEVAQKIEIVSDDYGYDDSDGLWHSNYETNVDGYYGGSFDVIGTENETGSENSSSGSFSWAADVSMEFDGYTNNDGTCELSGVSQVAERASGSINKSTGEFSSNALYEFGFSVSLSNDYCAGKYLLFMTVSGSDSGVAYDQWDFIDQVYNTPVYGSGYIRIYDNDDNMVREIELSDSDMYYLYPDPGS